MCLYHEYLLCTYILDNMITVEEAKNLVEKNCRVLPSEVLPLFETLGRVLAEDVYSKVDIPGFPQSAMDGYAVNCSGDIEKGDQFRVVAEVQAGDRGVLPAEAAGRRDLRSGRDPALLGNHADRQELSPGPHLPQTQLRSALARAAGG